MDNNYPPYVFEDYRGRLQGFLIDEWRLWEKKTGIVVKISALDWSEALRRMKAGEFDVIDTVFQTQSRNDYLDFSKPYASIDVAIFFEKDVSGIHDIDSLKGFPVAVKEGDAAVDLLRQKGIGAVLLFKNYESIIEAARQHKVNVFIMDKPPALYFLNKLGIEDEFRYSPPINVGEFHRAVRKGNAALLRTVEEGFARFTPAESKQIKAKWFGTAPAAGHLLVDAAYVAAAAAVLIAALFFWNWTLHRMVKRRTAALQESERRFREAIEFLPIPISLADNRGGILHYNREFVSRCGYTREDTPTLADWLARACPDAALRKSVADQWNQDAIRAAAKEDSTTPLREYPVTCKDGRQRQVEVRMRAVGNLYITCFNDVTDRKAHEEEIETLNRLYAVLSQVNQWIVRVQSRPELFTGICRVLVEFGGFKMAWVGWLNPDTQEVEVAACFGDTTGYLEGVRVFADDRPEGRGPTGRCIREARPYVCNDFFRDPSTAPWREAAARAGIRGSTALPIRLRGEVCGALMIYSGQTGFFGDKEVELLVEAAADVSFALDHLVVEAEHRQAEQALRGSEQRFRSAFDDAPAGMCLTGPDNRMLQVNHALCQMLGWTEAELLSKSFTEITHPDDVAESRKVAARMLAGELDSADFEKRFLRQDQQVVWAFVRTFLLRDTEGRPLHFITHLLDVTDRKRAEEDLRKSREQLRALLAQLQRLREEERTRIAREVHDVLGQLLTGLKMDMAWCEPRLRKIDDASLRRSLEGKLADTSRLTDTMIESVQKLSRELRPSVLDNIGLGAALEFETRQFQERTGIQCQISIPSETTALDSEVATGMFRVFQEILTNVARHAQATRVAVALTRLPEDLRLEVRDNGRGINSQDLARPLSLGLLGMRERASLLGGRIDIGGGAEGGTTVTLTIPLVRA